MATEPGIVVTGAAGRMGQMLIHAVAEASEPFTAALVRSGHPWAGHDAGEVAGLGPLDVPVFDDAIEAFARARAVIDFTTPDALETHAMLAAQARAALVVGTTGLTEAHQGLLQRAARHAPIVLAANTSLGVSLLADLTRRVAAALPGWDVEVMEAHHRTKRDAPSGTALMLGEAAAQARAASLSDLAAHERSGERPDDAIGFAVTRGGDVVGEHDVAFFGPGERLVLRHVATDRMIFARGALRAALWAMQRPPGLYTMHDVLGLRGDA